MSSIIVSGDTSGAITVAAPAVAGTYTNTLPQITGTLSTLDSGTAVTASGTSVDFSIPANAKRITVMFRGISTSGTSNIQVQLGDSGGIETTSYSSSASNVYGTNLTVVASSSTGLLLTASTSGTITYVGSVVISKITGNDWCSFGILGSGTDSRTNHGGGSKSLSDTLTTVRITTVNGTDTFDAGTINIMYE